jgi:hypothetical protein
VARTRKLVAALTRRGPHRVLRGDLAFAGLPGVVYTPEAGLNLPAIAFGHDWLVPTERYAGLLEHLASWGIVAGAPGTQRGLAPSVLNLAFDLGTALDIVAGVRLGPGKISVHPAKLAAVVAIFPTFTSPPAEQPAATLKVPGLILTTPGDPTTLISNALSLSRVWDAATLRIVKKGEAAGLAEGRRLRQVMGLGGPHRGTQKAVRALITGYLLATLAGDKTYRDFADPDLQLPRTVPVDLEAPPVTPEEKIVALLK